MNELIDLKMRFGGEYRIIFDPAVAGKRNTDPMYWIIPCRMGEIYAFGGEFLAALINKPKAVKRLQKFSEFELHQKARDAVVFKFHVRDFDKVAKIVGARRKRQVTSERMRKTGSKTAYRAGIRPENQRSVVR